MANQPANLAASVRQRLQNFALENSWGFDVVLIAFGLERLIYRLSVSDYRDQFVLKGGMLVTLWTIESGRFTRDVDFLAFVENNEANLKAIFTDILSIDADDGLVFDTGKLTTAEIRTHQVYTGTRLKTKAYFGRAEIPITIDLGFGDVLSDPVYEIKCASLLGLKSANIRAYTPANFIAEKLQAVVALGVANSRMKDFYDLWSVPKAVEIDPSELTQTLISAFSHRNTLIPSECPGGLTEVYSQDPLKIAQWSAYMEANSIQGITLREITQEIWSWLKPICQSALEVNDG